MSVVTKIALRNIRRHKTKTLIIGILMMIGMMVLIVGNSLMDTASRGIARTYVESYTGHVVISGRHQGNLSLVGLEGNTDFDTPIPTIPAYEEVYRHVTSQPFVQAVNPQGTALVLVDHDGALNFTIIFGIDPLHYRGMFPDNIDIVQGRMLGPGEEGIVLSAEIAAQLEKESGGTIAPGDGLLLTSMSQTAGIKVREVPVRGIFRFRNANPQTDFVSLVDITTVRALSGMNVSGVTEADLTEQERALLDSVDEDALFGGFDDMFSAAGIEEISIDERPLTEDDLLAGFTARAETNTELNRDSHAWHFLLVRLQDGTDPASVITEFQRFFDENGIDAQASNWLSGAGSVARLANGTKAVFNVVVLVIAIVAVIIIMNTLVISVTERTVEIGTMRALGAQKQFVRRLIMWETLLTSGIFGGLGIFVGIGILFVLRRTGIEAPNVFFEILFGGPVLYPLPSASAVAMSFIVIVAVALAASLYPVSVALKAEPIKAMQE